MFIYKYIKHKLQGAGWIVGIPGAIMVLGAQNFGTVASSNMFLGLNQSMAWSAVIYMLIDIFGTRAGTLIYIYIHMSISCFILPTLTHNRSCSRCRRNLWVHWRSFDKCNHGRSRECQ